MLGQAGRLVQRRTAHGQGRNRCIGLHRQQGLVAPDGGIGVFGQALGAEAAGDDFVVIHYIQDALVAVVGADVFHLIGLVRLAADHALEIFDVIHDRGEQPTPT